MAILYGWNWGQSREPFLKGELENAVMHSLPLRRVADELNRQPRKTQLKHHNVVQHILRLYKIYL